MQCLLILCFEHEAWRTFLATFHADYVLPTHGAEVGEAIQFHDAGA